MKRVWILYRHLGLEEKQVAVAAFITPVGAVGAKKIIEGWFKKNPRPPFDDVWDDRRGRLDPLKLRLMTCPYDPGHVDDTPFEVPRYSIEQLDIMTAREFYDHEGLATARADRELFGAGRTNV